VKKIQQIFLVLMLLMHQQLMAQTDQPKFSVNGAARSIFFLDALEQDLITPDTITPAKSNAGHALVDLGINVRPDDNIEVQGMIRIRNDFGGFWGSGVTFDVRQLYVKGVLKNIVRYQLGDINYKLTPYTLYNSDHELSQNSPVLFNHLSEVVRYDNFYDIDNTWRQQGAAVDFGLNFSSVIDEMQFNLFTSRVVPSNLSSVNDRLFSAFNIGIVQSKYLQLGLNYANLYDLKGTSKNDQLLSNPVWTGSAALHYNLSNFQLSATGEAGTSSTIIFEDLQAPEMTDAFFDTRFEVEYVPAGVLLSVGVKRVGPDFRSPGAQTKRIHFGAFPAAFERITNDQILRPLTMMDLMRETSLYNRQIQHGLMEFNPLYDNITPYGAASPNRQGFDVGVTYTTKDEDLELSASFLSQTEVRGQGTTNLRSFTRIEAGIIYNLAASLLNSERLLDVSAHMRLDQTSRVADAEGIPTVDLSTSIVGLGLEAELIKQLDLVAGYQVHAFSGFELLNTRNEYGEIINFSELTADGFQQMWGSGLRFRFSEKVYIMAQWNSFDWYDVSTTTSLRYKMNDLALIYSMKF
jgi:hypothetical protein